VSYLVNEVLLRLVKPAITAVLALVIYLVATTLLGEPGSVLLALASWIAAACFVLLAETGVI
jgi:hypothetical protein